MWCLLLCRVCIAGGYERGEKACEAFFGFLAAYGKAWKIKGGFVAGTRQGGGQEGYLGDR